jgi:hypothetical protein
MQYDLPIQAFGQTFSFVYSNTATHRGKALATATLGYDRGLHEIDKLVVRVELPDAEIQVGMDAYWHFLKIPAVSEQKYALAETLKRMSRDAIVTGSEIEIDFAGPDSSEQTMRKLMLAGIWRKATFYYSKRGVRARVGIGLGLSEDDDHKKDVVCLTLSEDFTQPPVLATTENGFDILFEGPRDILIAWLRLLGDAFDVVSEYARGVTFEGRSCNDPLLLADWLLVREGKGYKRKNAA